MIESWLKAWLERWHGRGEDYQAEYYRCHGCRRIVTWVAIRRGGCTCKVSNKLSPAVLSLVEKVQLVVLPWRCVR